MKYNDVRHTENKRRREEMRPVQQRYGFFRVPGGATHAVMCTVCNSPINGKSLNICGEMYHEECFNQTR